MTGWQGMTSTIVRRSSVLLLAVPIVIQVYFNSSLAYLLMRKLRVPHNVASPGALNLTVGNAVSPTGLDSGIAYLASQGGALLGDITVPGETRIKVTGSIINAPVTAVNTGNLILESAQGTIGGATIRFTFDLCLLMDSVVHYAESSQCSVSLCNRLVMFLARLLDFGGDGGGVRSLLSEDLIDEVHVSILSSGRRSVLPVRAPMRDGRRVLAIPRT